MTASQHTIAGTVLTMPVKIRTANQHMAMFSVDADAAQQLIDYSGLQVCRYLPGRAIVVLMLMHYIDGDLGQYLEYGTNVMVNPPGSNASGPRALQLAGAFIHHLPVDQAFTLEAGQTIWGYPKVMADFTVRDGRQFGFDVSIDGQLAVGMEFQPGLPIPSAFTSHEQGIPHLLASRRCHTRNPWAYVAYRCALPVGRCAGVAGRSPVRHGTRLARLAETRPCVEFCCQREDVVRRRCDCSLRKGGQ